MDFKSFNKIAKIGDLYMEITQKIHGTNAQICIEYVDHLTNLDTPKDYQLVRHKELVENDYKIYAGSRNRWLTIEDDNYGFAKFVADNRQKLVEMLGVGQHYGEWAGPGINEGEGLSRRVLFLFNQSFHARPNLLPDQISVVPVIYQGKILNPDEIDSQMDLLKKYGSFIDPVFFKDNIRWMMPEGIVVKVNKTLYKKTFGQEEVAWKPKHPKQRTPSRDKAPDVSHLLQPIRLEKILSREEKFQRDYPRSLPDICSAYFHDLKDENQLPQDMSLSFKRTLAKEIFSFIKYTFTTK